MHYWEKLNLIIGFLFFDEFLNIINHDIVIDPIANKFHFNEIRKLSGDMYICKISVKSTLY